MSSQFQSSSFHSQVFCENLEFKRECWLISIVCVYFIVKLILDLLGIFCMWSLSNMVYVTIADVVIYVKSNIYGWNKNFNKCHKRELSWYLSNFSYYSVSVSAHYYTNIYDLNYISSYNNFLRFKYLLHSFICNKIYV